MSCPQPDHVCKDCKSPRTSWRSVGRGTWDYMATYDCGRTWRPGHGWSGRTEECRENMHQQELTELHAQLSRAERVAAVTLERLHKSYCNRCPDEDCNMSEDSQNVCRAKLRAWAEREAGGAK